MRNPANPAKRIEVAKICIEAAAMPEVHTQGHKRTLCLSASWDLAYARIPCAGHCEARLHPAVRRACVIAWK